MKQMLTWSLVQRAGSLHLDSVLTADDLTEVEKKMFCREHTFSRGKRAGQTVKSGLIHREEDRFFLWSNDEGDV